MDFISAWVRTGCEKTSPVNQRYLIHDQNVEEHYNLTHPIKDACLIAEIYAATGHDKVTAAGSANDPHYCQNGHYEKDQAAKGRADGAPADEGKPH
jgi:hypothetical protein